TSTATRVAAGTSSRRSSSRFAANSPLIKLIPVRLPPGRARLATRPGPTGSSLETKTMGIVVVAALAANPEPPAATMRATMLCGRARSPAALAAARAPRAARGSRAAEERDELAPLHGLPQPEGHTLPHRCSNAALCITAKLIVGMTRWVNLDRWPKATSPFLRMPLMATDPVCHIELSRSANCPLGRRDSRYGLPKGNSAKPTIGFIEPLLT